MESKTRALAETLFANHETRFRRKEKDAFLDTCKAAFSDLGYQESEINTIEAGGKNLMVGPPDADYIITAHYDTPGCNGILLFANPWVGQVWGNVVLLALMCPLFFLLGLVSGGSLIGLDIHPAVNLLFTLTLLGLFILLFTVKNKHNHNDNTSGVLGVFSVAAQVVQNPGLRGKCAFVLFDNEEWFLVGSSAFAKWRKKTYPDKQFSQVFNMDCIADGDVLVLAAKREFEGLLELAGAMKAEGFTVAIKYSKMVYMSDHAVFKRGVMLSFLKRSKAGPLYIPRIHTRTDTFCDLDNLEKLGGAVYRHIGKIAN